MLTYTRRKKHIQEVGVAEDRMSNFPDAILTRILSFLLTKEAVRTAILSKRWKSVWASVSTLYLRQGDFRLKTEGFCKDEETNVKARFLNFVDGVLIGHNMPFLEKVGIRGFIHIPSHIRSWICAAVEQNIRELVLEFDCYVDSPQELPQSLFSCNTLVVLKLSLHMVLNFPMTSTGLPNLKVLQLVTVIYKDDDSAQNLFSSCPALEDLTLVREEWDNLQNLNVTSLSLKKLSVEFSLEDGFSLEDDQDHARKMVIDASSLETIDIVDNVTQEYVIRDLSSLIKAKLLLSNCYAAVRDSGNYAKCLSELLRRISCVKILLLSCYTVLSLSVANSYYLPTFHNLTRLEFFAVEDFETEWNWELVLEFLKSSPVLEVLTFEGFTFSSVEEFDPSQWDVPSCLLSHLKTITIRELLIWEREVEEVNYFLTNAKVLEKMTITFLDWQKPSLKLEFVEALQMLPRGSNACRIEIF